MIETGIVEIDIDNIEALNNSTSSTNKSTLLKNPFAQSKSEMSNKRPIYQSSDISDIEQNVKKIRQELKPVQMSIDNGDLLDDDIIEINDEVKKEPGDPENEVDQTELSKTQESDHNFQEQNDHNTRNVRNNNNTSLEYNNQSDKEQPRQEDIQIEVNKNNEECEIVWTGAGDKSIEDYIKEEIEKRVNERVEAFRNVAKVEMIEHELILMNKYKKIETELTLELENQKSAEKAVNIKYKIQEEHEDELVQAILLEKKLEEKELMLKSRIEKLKLIESKFVQQLLEIKSIRKQNRELLKMKTKEWEDEEKFSLDGQQDILIKHDEVLINDEPNDCECTNDTEASKPKSSVEKVESEPKFNESHESIKTQLSISRVEREKCRPTRMSPGEWEYEKKERSTRKRNIKIEGLKSWMGPRDLETFFKREMGVIVKVERVLRIGTNIVVQFRDMIDKITIFKRVKSYNRGISITNDLTPREEEVQKWLRDEADWLRLKGYSVKTEQMRLMINGINWVWNEVLGDLIPKTI